MREEFKHDRPEVPATLEIWPEKAAQANPRARVGRHGWNFRHNFGLKYHR
jgi:hypothetical protein